VLPPGTTLLKVSDEGVFGYIDKVHVRSTTVAIAVILLASVMLDCSEEGDSDIIDVVVVEEVDVEDFDVVEPPVAGPLMLFFT
jgi:hypothetical protein